MKEARQLTRRMTGGDPGIGGEMKDRTTPGGFVSGGTRGRPRASQASGAGGEEQGHLSFRCDSSDINKSWICTLLGWEEKTFYFFFFINVCK